MNWFRSHKREGGVAMVEFAVMLPVIAVILVGVVEFGFAFKTKLLVDNAIQVAARTGASLGQAEDVDLRILEALEQGLANLPNNGDGVVLQAQVYQVASDGTPSATKLNTYVYAYNSNPLACNWAPCPVTEAQVPTWKPSARATTLSAGLDTIGVKVYYGYNWLIGGFPFLDDVSCNVAPDCWTETAIMRLEPSQ